MLNLGIIMIDVNSITIIIDRGIMRVKKVMEEVIMAMNSPIIK